MASIDVEQLLQAVSAESPFGDDLEYDAAYQELMRAAAGKPPQEMGGQIIPGQEPNWRDVREQAAALLGRTKDLRISVMLAEALLRTDGLAGFGDGLRLIRGLVERHWEGMHPRLDPDDDNDPTLRVNTLGTLTSREGAVAALRMLPLASSRRVGRYGLRHLDIANGAIPRPAGEDVVDKATIEAAFLDMDSAELEANAAAAGAAVEQLQGLDEAMKRSVGASASGDFSLLTSTLRSMHSLLQQQLARRGMAGDPSALESAGSVSQPAEGRPAMSGPVQSREDVIRALDQVCDWYDRHEPSSPVPLLLRRAKRLVNKSFLEAVQDLTPGGLNEIQTIAGMDTTT